MAVINFGVPALRVLALAGAAAMLVEAACERLMKRDSDVDTFQPLVVGLVFAMFLPPSAPWWLTIVGASISILLGRMVFGGVGASPLCAPLVGWAVCNLSWPMPMEAQFTMLDTEWLDPLAQLKYFGPAAAAKVSLGDMLLGRQLGGLGATQVLAVLAGGALLLASGRARWEVPAGFVAGVVLAASAFMLFEPGQHGSPLLHLLGGSTLFGALFCATDDSSSPHLPLPMLLFGVLAGVMVLLIRVYGEQPDGVPYAILVANLFAPALARIRPKPFGAGG